MKQNQSIEKKFWLFALPSMLSQLLNSFFIIIDGFFVGQNLGDAGLAAINIAWPMVALIQAVSMAIGTGGAVELSLNIGRGEIDIAVKARGHSILMLLFTALFFGGVFFFTYPVILPLLGANEELYPMTAEYIHVVCIFAVCQVFTIGVMPLLRGAGRSIAAMSLTILGLLGNIWLDWLFIHHYRWGIQGVALATAISQGTCGLLGLILLLTSRRIPATRHEFRLRFKHMLRILHLGCSAFGLTISTSILILLTNLQALRYGGTKGVAVYAVLSYVLGSIIPLVSGVGDGILPLLGNAYGSGNHQAIANLRRKGFSLAVGSALLCSIGCYASRFVLPHIFGASPTVSAEISGAVWTLAAAFPFMAAVRFSCSYFCALGQPVESSALAYGEPLVMQPLFLFVLPLFLQLDGVWISYPAAMFCMALLALAFLYRHRKKLAL